MAFAACSSAVDSGSDSTGGNTSSSDSVEKVTIRLAGQTADESGAYSAELEAGDEESFTLVVGSLTDYAFTVVSSEPTVVSASVTQTTLTLEALAEGNSTVTLSENSDKAEDLVVNVSVTGSGTEAVAPTSLNISGIEDGSGDISDPYTVTFSSGKTSEPGGAAHECG